MLRKETTLSEISALESEYCENARITKANVYQTTMLGKVLLTNR